MNILYSERLVGVVSKTRINVSALALQKNDWTSVSFKLMAGCPSYFSEQKAPVGTYFEEYFKHISVKWGYIDLANALKAGLFPIPLNQLFSSSA